MSSSSVIQQGMLKGAERNFVMGAEKGQGGRFSDGILSFESVFLVLPRGEKQLYSGIFWSQGNCKQANCEVFGEEAFLALVVFLRRIFWRRAKKTLKN